MRKLPLLCLVMLVFAAVARADVQPAPPADADVVRELYVPFDDLNVVLENAPQRVMLSRQQYDELLKLAKARPDDPAPRQAAILSADYDAKGEDGRVVLHGKLLVEVLQAGWHALPLDLSGVGVRSVTLDGKAAPLGRADDGRPTLFVQGEGRHAVEVELVAPLQSDTARQTLNLTLPTPAAATLKLAVPGDVEVLSGAAVVSRKFDEQRQLTQFELLPQRGRLAMTMTLNGRLARTDRMVLAHSVQVCKVTQAVEQLHAAVTLDVMHRAVDRFRFAAPAGFEITSVSAPQAAQWTVTQQDGQAVLEVQMREPVTGRVTLNIDASRNAPDLQNWALPRFEPLEVVSQAAVVGLLMEDRLEAVTLTPAGLMPIDVQVLTQALPADFISGGAGLPGVRVVPVAAYYAPQSAYSLHADIRPTPEMLAVASHLLLTVDQQQMTAIGGFTLTPQAMTLHQVEFTAPPGWWVQSVTAADGKPLRFERFLQQDQATRIVAYLSPPGSSPGNSGAVQSVGFQATCRPDGWLDRWDKRQVPLPVFAVAGAQNDAGAIAVLAGPDLHVRPGATDGLLPLDDRDKARSGLAGVNAALTWRYDAPPYRGELIVERKTPRVNARTFAFIHIEPDEQRVRYELAYHIERARTDRVSLLLPASTPAAMAITGLDGVNVKEYVSEKVDDHWRRWTATLAEPRIGEVRLAVEFQQPVDLAEGTRRLSLPLAQADDVAYQSGLIAIEGSPELDIKLLDALRRVDVGELVDARYQPGKRLLGVYGFVGPPPAVSVETIRQTTYALPPAIVQQADLVTTLSANGQAVTQATFVLQTHGLFMQVRLPDGATLWTAQLNGRPTKPQRDGRSLLLDLPAKAGETQQTLAVVYASPIDALRFSGDVSLAAPQLLLHMPNASQPAPVPTADLSWKVHLPAGYELLDAGGTVTLVAHPRPTLAVTQLLRGGLWTSTPGCACCLPAMGTARRSARQMSDNTQARGIHQAMVTWAQSHDNRYPPNLGVLVVDNYFTPEYAVTSNSDVRVPPDIASWTREDQAEWVNRNSSFVLLTPGGKVELDAKKMVMIERAPAGSQRIVAWGDGHTSVEDVATYGQEQMADLTSQPPAAPQAVTGSTSEIDQAGLNEQAAQERPVPVALPSPAAPPAAASLAGVRSLTIALSPRGEAHQFRSLGVEPQLQLHIARQRQPVYLAAGLAGLVFLYGLWLLRRTAKVRAAYVLLWLLASTAFAIVVSRPDIVMICNSLFYAALLLAPVYGVVAFVRWAKATLNRSGESRPNPAAAAGVVLLMLTLFGAAQARAANAPDRDSDDHGPPVVVPADAIIVPYTSAENALPGADTAEKLLVPYDQFVELWNRAYPDKRLTETPAPAAYALAGARYAGTLSDDDESLLLRGSLEVDVMVDRAVQIWLPVEGGVLVQVTVDGGPAKLGVIETVVPPPPVQQQQAVQSRLPAETSMMVLHIKGQGRHRIELAVRLKLDRQGGWRIARARVPVAPAAALTLTAPEAHTDVQLPGVTDRTAYETETPGQQIATAIDPGGRLDIRWRPRVSQTQVDLSLRVESLGVVDLQEDAVRLSWAFDLRFPHGTREQFEVAVPRGYHVEKVLGSNVRGWEVNARDAGDVLEVTLLKAAQDHENFTVLLRQPEAIAEQGETTLPAPQMSVAGAALQSGVIVLRRSAMLDVRTTQIRGLTRTDLPADAAIAKVAGDADSPLGLRAFEAYRFATLPFDLQMQASPAARKTSAQWQTILRLAAQQRQVESRVLLDVSGRPLYRLRLELPADMQVQEVEPGPQALWNIATQDGRQVLNIQYMSGRMGVFQVVFAGTLGPRGEQRAMTLPQFKVLDADEQQGDLVVQVDPAFDVAASQLEHIESVQLGRVYRWLKQDQRALTRLALHFDQPDYAGQLQLTARRAEVSCTTLTNVRTTKRSLEYTLLLDFAIRQAGIREVQFLLPESLKDARISVPLLREKTVAPAADKPGWVKVTLLLQDDVTEQLRVLIEDDQLLTEQSCDAPIPTVLTGRTTMRYVALENTGRDEAVIEQAAGLDPVNRQGAQARWIAQFVGDALTHVYAVNSDAGEPTLRFKTQHRETVQTAGARIGLAQSYFTLDEQGAYRASTIFHMDNATEQFLEVELPEGATLWTATVAGQAVRPAKPTGAAMARRVRIPLIKTAVGDLDYEVILRYAGVMPRPGRAAAVQFPLVRTVNIDVELSQASLWLPADMTWFDFGGTMRRVEDPGAMRLGEIAYLTNKSEQLMQVLRDENPFASARAAASLERLKSESGELEKRSRETGDYQRNDQLQAQLQTQQQLFDNIDDLNAARPLAQQAADVQLDNRYRLNEAFEKQNSLRSSNQVMEQDYNFERKLIVTAETETTTTKSKAAFKAKWAEQEGQLDRPTMDKSGGKADTWFTNDELAQMASNSRVSLNARDAEEESAKRLGDMAKKQQAAYLKDAKEERNATADGALADRYRQKLAYGDANAGFRFRDGGTQGGGSGEPARLGSLDGDAMNLRAVDAAAAEQAWVSLDVRMPRRGAQYNFTTPLGDATITARAVGGQTLATLWRLAALAAAALVGLALYRWWPRRKLTPAKWMALILTAGVVSLVTGVVIPLGVALLLVGAAVGVVLAIAHPRPRKLRPWKSTVAVE